MSYEKLNEKRNFINSYKFWKIMLFKKKKKNIELPKKLSEWRVKHYWFYVWHGEQWHSFLVFCLLAFIFVKFVFFPTLGLALGTDYPVVAIVTGSMEHKIVNNHICGVSFKESKTKSLNLEEYWEICGERYEKNFNIYESDFRDFKYSNGMNVGDVIILVGADIEEIKIGDVIVFIPQDKQNGESAFFTQFGPVIHRVVSVKQKDKEKSFQTKGDANAISKANFEVEIPQEDILGVPIIKIPYLGYPKILLSKLYFKIRG